MNMRRIFSGVVATLIFAAALLGAPSRAQFADQQTYKVTTGSANAYAIQLPNVSAMGQITGVLIKFTPNFSNTGAATISVNGLTAVAIQKPTQSGPVALTGGELIASPTAQASCGIWNGSVFLLVCNLNASPAATVPTPQGYLTPCQVTVGSPVSGCTAGQAVQTGDVISATTLYYEPFVGNQIPIFNGSSFVVQAFAELTLAIPGSRLANSLYDACITTATAGVYSTTGTPTIVFSVAWTTSTVGSGSRGTGAGTAQITQLNGVWVNAVQFSGVNGATTIANIPANACTMVGTVLIDATPGQITAQRSYGQARRWAYWNFANRVPIAMRIGDSTASWTYGTSTIRPSNGNSANSGTFVVGLQQDSISARFDQVVTSVSSGTNANPQILIGFNSTTAGSGFGSNTRITPGSVASYVGPISAAFQTLPPLGASTVTQLEDFVQGTSSAIFQGTEQDMLMTIWWRG